MHGSGPGQGLHPLDFRGETLLQILKINKGSVSSLLALIQREHISLREEESNVKASSCRKLPKLSVFGHVCVSADGSRMGNVLAV